MRVGGKIGDTAVSQASAHSRVSVHILVDPSQRCWGYCTCTNLFNIGQVQPSSQNISGDNDRVASIQETFNYSTPSLLSHISMHTNGRQMRTQLKIVMMSIYQ